MDRQNDSYIYTPKTLLAYRVLLRLRLECLKSKCCVYTLEVFEYPIVYFTIYNYMYVDKLITTVHVSIQAIKQENTKDSMARLQFQNLNTKVNQMWTTDGQTDGRTSSIYKQELLWNLAKNDLNSKMCFIPILDSSRRLSAALAWSFIFSLCTFSGVLFSVPDFEPFGGRPRFRLPVSISYNILYKRTQTSLQLTQYFSLFIKTFIGGMKVFKIRERQIFCVDILFEICTLFIYH